MLTENKVLYDYIGQELTALQTVSHPNIVKVEKLLQDQQNFYVVMEHIKGGTLYDRIVNSGKFDIDFAASKIKEIIEAVNYMHHRKLVHRDLKPENLLVDDQQEMTVKITDFGFAREFD